MSVEIMNLKQVSKGVLICFADIYIPKLGLEIYGCSLCQKNGKKWLNMPQREYTNAEGEKKYLSIVRYREREVQDAFGEAVIKAIDKKILEDAGQKPRQQMPIQDDLPF